MKLRNIAAPTLIVLGLAIFALAALQMAGKVQAESETGPLPNFTCYWSAHPGHGFSINQPPPEGCTTVHVFRGLPNRREAR